MAACAAVLLVGGCAAHDQPGAGQGSATTTIPFVRNIDYWQPDGRNGLYIRTIDKRWYYAAFMSPCIDLPYATSIGYQTWTSSLSKYDGITVGNRTCKFKSLDPSPGPGRPDQAVPPKPAAPAPAQS